MNILKKIASYILIGLVLVFTVIGLLGIWGVIDLKDIIGRIMSSLLVIFASSAVLLFIFSVLIKEDQQAKS